MEFMLYIDPGTLSIILYHSFSIMYDCGLVFACFCLVLFSVTEISSPQLIFFLFYPILGCLLNIPALLDQVFSFVVLQSLSSPNKLTP